MEKYPITRFRSDSKDLKLRTKNFLRNLFSLEMNRWSLQALQRAYKNVILGSRNKSDKKMNLLEIFKLTYYDNLQP